MPGPARNKDRAWFAHDMVQARHARAGARRPFNLLKGPARFIISKKRLADKP
jgi:hypothetical protein